MLAQSNPEVLVSMPLPLIVAAVLFLILLASMGWRYRARRRARAAVRNSGTTSWLPALLDALPCGAILIDEAGQVRFANSQAVGLFGAISRQDELPAVVHSLVERARVSAEREGPEVHALPGQGQPMWIETVPIGEAAGVLAIVTENRGDGAAAGIHQRLSQTLAHELRTPLTAIIGHTDILGSCSIHEEDLWRRSQQFIAREVERLARLVEDLLTFSRLDTAAPNLSAVNLRAVAEQAISTSWQAAEAKGVSLVLHAPGNLPRVRGDADWLQQVFVNLIDNSLKYTPSGGQVGVRLTAQEAWVRAEISDSGIGIPISDQAHICEPFFRSEAARQTAPGTGMGLTIVQAILHHHGAELHVQSEPQHGTTVSFEIPKAH